ncbi:MAG TPA: hypothetical protein VF395_22300 [Polyangiaceae bacterium]
MIGSLSLSGCAASSDGGQANGRGSGGAKPAGGTNVGGGANPAGGTAQGGRAGFGNTPNGGATNPNGGAPPQGGNVGAGGEGAMGAGGAGPKIFDSGMDPARNQVQAGQVCERIATIQCAGEAFCCDAPGRTQAECKDTMKQGCINQLYLDAITANRISGYDTANAEAIFTEYERLASTCDQTVTAWGASIEGLRGLAKGTVQSGGSCIPNPISTNRAVVAPYLAACLNPATTACYPQLAAWTCSPRSNSGSKCFADTNCNDGLYCDNPNFLITGSTCKPRKADGAACKLLDECASLLCKHGTCAPLNQQNAFCLKDG